MVLEYNFLKPFFQQNGLGMIFILQVYLFETENFYTDVPTYIPTKNYYILQTEMLTISWKTHSYNKFKYMLDWK
jgi:hypothetical protein